MTCFLLYAFAIEIGTTLILIYPTKPLLKESWSPLKEVLPYLEPQQDVGLAFLGMGEVVILHGEKNFGLVLPIHIDKKVDLHIHGVSRGHLLRTSYTTRAIKLLNGPQALIDRAQVEIDLDLVVLESDEWKTQARVAIEPEH